jgi:acetyltransferase
LKFIGALAGADEVADAVFERAGVLRVFEIADLFALTELLSYQPLPQGPKLTIITNAG